MHTGIISFADRIAFNIKSNDIKDIILEQLSSLYNIKIIQKHYHKLDDVNVKYVKKLPHLCNLRSNGNPYYIFFTLYNDVPIIYFIDKKVHPGYQKPRILLARGLFDISLYKNTLLDGEMVKCNDNKWTFLINDIICNEGVFLQKESLPERLNIIYNLLETKHTPNNIIDVCNYKVKTYFYPYQDSIYELIKISKLLNYTCRGIYLWSYDIKHKPKLYNFDEDIIINVVRKVKDETEFKTFTDNNSIDLISKTIISDAPVSSTTHDTADNMTLNSDERILWITKTDEPDVYNVYDNENTLSTEKIGIAFVQGMTISRMLRLSFKNKNAATNLKYKCIFNNKFNKWQPIELLQ
jgi:hypothetical protein